MPTVSRAGGLWAQRQRLATDAPPKPPPKPKKRKTHPPKQKGRSFQKEWKAELAAAKREHRAAGGGNMMEWLKRFDNAK